MLKLFNSIVLPVLFYNSEIWGSFLKVKSLGDANKFKNNLFDETHKHEQLLNRICKYTLGVNKKASNIAVKAELGVYHLNIEIYVRIVKFFFHLGRLGQQGNKLIINSLIECFNLWKQGGTKCRQFS